MSGDMRIALDGPRGGRVEESVPYGFLSAVVSLGGTEQPERLPFCIHGVLLPGDVTFFPRYGVPYREVDQLKPAERAGVGSEGQFRASSSTWL
jgi:hypothetical protein